ncbi:MAG TPA: GatB/YqeY domain-containing protein [Thermoanaerobaculia bacterium]|nr:GatB/YqeY domain-containing protein [Thermoanaerobaculia bacterium]
MQARLEAELKIAMKAGEKRRVATLRLLLSALKNERIALGRELSNEEVEASIRRAVKQRREAIEQYERGGRQDLVDAETEELAILQGYLPQELSEAEVEQAVRTIASEKNLSSARDVGLVMKELMARYRGRLDGKRAQEIARRLLS